MKTRYQIIDTTLREGEQAPGVFLTAEQKRLIIGGLVGTGISEVELGIAAPLAPCQASLVRFCREHYPSLQLSLWSRCLAEDIEQAAVAAVDTVSLSIPVSDLLLATKLGRNRGWAEQTACDAIHRVRELGLSAAIGFEDATRADRAFLLELSSRVEEAGAWRIRLADTVGIVSPLAMAGLVGELKRDSMTRKLPFTPITISGWRLPMPWRHLMPAPPGWMQRCSGSGSDAAAHDSKKWSVIWRWCVMSPNCLSPVWSSWQMKSPQ